MTAAVPMWSSVDKNQAVSLGSVSMAWLALSAEAWKSYFKESIESKLLHRTETLPAPLREHVGREKNTKNEHNWTSLDWLPCGQGRQQSMLHPTS